MEATINNSKAGDQNEYINFLANFQTANPTAPAIDSTDTALIAEYVVKHAPDGKATEWLKQLLALSIAKKDKQGTPIGLIALALGALAIGAFLAYGVFTEEFLLELAKPNVARGLITFLFTFATIAIFVIASIAIFWTKFEEVDKRASLAKELIAVMIGVLGTILGFYFGSAETGTTQVPQEQVAPADVGEDSEGQ